MSNKNFNLLTAKRLKSYVITAALIWVMCLKAKA